MTAAIDNDEFSAGLNEFRDDCSVFRRTFELEGNSAMTRIADCITQLLLTGCDRGVQLNDETHPFVRYASYDRTEKQNLDNLARDVRREFQDNMAVRSCISSFFHAGGVNYDDLKELFDTYMEWVDGCILDDEDDEDEEDEDEEEESGSSSESSI
jgi:hypothetical protein